VGQGWGRVLISKRLGIGFSVLILSAEVFGGPTPPHIPKEIPPAGVANREGRLDEISPLIEEISFVTSPTTLEVFIDAWAYTDCYDKQENIVNLKKEFTEIIPRRIRTHPNDSCRNKYTKFHEKVAELDINDPRSKDIRILGFRGWHHRNFERP
jgi:hypothetical protein